MPETVFYPGSSPGPAPNFFTFLNLAEMQKQTVLLSLEGLSRNRLVEVYNLTVDPERQIYPNDAEDLNMLYSDAWILARAVFYGTWKPHEKYLAVCIQTGNLISSDDPTDLMSGTLADLAQTICDDPDPDKYGLYIEEEEE